MVLKFDYTKLATTDPTRPWVARPLVPIRLVAKSRFAQTLALIDSGADYSIFHSDYAEALGLTTDIGESRKIRGIEGTDVLVYFHTVELQVVGTPEKIKMAVGFADSPGIDAILGQSEFFMHFDIKFGRAKERIELKRTVQKET